MKTIKIHNGAIIEVSEELYTTTTDPGLYRKVSGLEGHTELGWHPHPDWITLIADATCQKAWFDGGVPLHGKTHLEHVYIGFHCSWVMSS